MTPRDTRYCPYLGLPEDQSSFFVYPTPIHRCHRASQPLPIHPDDQETYCLSPRHTECPRFRDPTVTLAPAGPDADPANIYERYGWEATAGQGTNRQAWVRGTVIGLAAVTIVAAVVILWANQARLRRVIESGWRGAWSGQLTPRPTTPTGLPLVVSLGTPTATATPFATWTPTPTVTPTATNTPTETPTPTVTPTPTETPPVTPTATSTPIPTPTPTPKPQYIPRSPIRYEPSCEATLVRGYVYDAFGNMVAGQKLRLWNDYGYSTVTITEAAGQGRGEGYYEFYLYPGPYEKAESFYLAVVDPASEQPISPRLSVEFTPDRCQPGEGGRQIAIVDWVYNP